MKREDANGIDERSFRFYQRVLTFLETVPENGRTRKLIEQPADSLRA